MRRMSWLQLRSGYLLDFPSQVLFWLAFWWWCFFPPFKANDEVPVPPQGHLEPLWGGGDASRFSARIEGLSMFRQGLRKEAKEREAKEDEREKKEEEEEGSGTVPSEWRFKELSGLQRPRRTEKPRSVAIACPVNGKRLFKFKFLFEKFYFFNSLNPILGEIDFFSLLNAEGWGLAEFVNLTASFACMLPLRNIPE